jgi:ribosomal protein L29
MKKSELRQLIREEIKKTLTEATTADIMAVVSDIRRFNRNEIKEIDDLVLRTLKNIRFKATPDNIEVVTDHFEQSMDDNYKIPVDPVIVRELYPMLK